MLTVNENKIQLIDLICSHLIEKCVPSGEPDLHKLVISGREPIPTQLFCGHRSHRADLRTTHEEADVTMVYLVLQVSQTQEGVDRIKVICDDTDVFMSIIMEATSPRGCPSIFRPRLKGVEPHVLVAHGLTGCDTVAKLNGIGKSTVIKKLKEGHTFQHLGDLSASLDDDLAEATVFIASCYDSKERNDLSQVRVDL